MKNYLTNDQMHHLTTLGFTDHIFHSEVSMCGTIPYVRSVCSLRDLTAVLPKVIMIENRPYSINIWYSDLENAWVADYMWADEETDPVSGGSLLDTLYNLLLWCIENEHYPDPKYFPLVRVTDDTKRHL